jgi:hypothetical protein
MGTKDKGKNTGKVHSDGPKKAGRKAGGSRHSSVARNLLPEEADRIDRNTVAFNELSAQISSIRGKIEGINSYIDGWAEKHIVPADSDSMRAFRILKQQICFNNVTDLELESISDMPDYERDRYYDFLEPFSSQFTNLNEALQRRMSRLNRFL